MKVREIMETECLALAKRLKRELGLSEDIKIVDLFNKAIDEGKFSPDEYVYSDDPEVLYDMLVYSLGLSKLWTALKKEKPDANIICLNPILIKYMMNMYGLEVV